MCIVIAAVFWALQYSLGQMARRIRASKLAAETIRYVSAEGVHTPAVFFTLPAANNDSLEPTLYSRECFAYFRPPAHAYKCACAQQRRLASLSWYAPARLPTRPPLLRMLQSRPPARVLACTQDCFAVALRALPLNLRSCVCLNPAHPPARVLACAQDCFAVALRPLPLLSSRRHPAPLLVHRWAGFGVRRQQRRLYGICGSGSIEGTTAEEPKGVPPLRRRRRRAPWRRRESRAAVVHFHGLRCQHEGG